MDQIAQSPANTCWYIRFYEWRCTTIALYFPFSNLVRFKSRLLTKNFYCMYHLDSCCREGEFVDLEKEFEPNILNSVVYLIDMGMQVSTFAVNYRGEPFMQSLWSHKPLRNCLLITFIVVLALTAHLMPELNEWFQLVPFPHDVSIYLLTNRILWTTVNPPSLPLISNRAHACLAARCRS